MKNFKNNNIILGFSFMYLVSVYPTQRQSLIQQNKNVQFHIHIHTIIFLLQGEDSVDADVLNSYCWMYSSFDIPNTFNFPCTRKNKEESTGTHLYNTYYQWVSIFLAVQAGLFYIPRCIWLIIEGGLMSYMVKGKTKF